MSDSPEILRRAWNRTTGDRASWDLHCRSWRHRWRIRRLARLGDAELRRRLERLQVRLDPPQWERICSCET